MYSLNPNQYYDLKLLDKVASELVFDWEKYYKKMKKKFNYFSFLVIENNKIIYSDIAFSFNSSNDFLKIQISRLMHKKLYIIHLHSKDNSLKLETEQSTQIIHDNIALSGVSQVELFAHKNIHYTHIVNNKVCPIFYQDIIFEHARKSICYFFESAKSAKNKVNQKHILKAKSNLDIHNINQLMNGQIRDDFIEVEHAEENTKSVINYLALNGGKCVSQINSIIAPKAINSETHQHIKHLLTSDKSQSFSKPNLMIKNPIVIASHGNSIGSYSDDDLFYIMQKGLNLENAQKIIQSGMLHSSLDNHPQSNLFLAYFHKEKKHE